MPTGFEPEAAVGTGDGGGLPLALLGNLPLPGTFEGCNVGHALDGDPVGVNDVESDFLPCALRAKNNLIRGHKTDNKTAVTIRAEITAETFTSSSPDICFLQFLLRLPIGAEYRLQLAGAFVLHLYGDQPGFPYFNHAAWYHTHALMSTTKIYYAIANSPRPVDLSSLRISRIDRVGWCFHVSLFKPASSAELVFAAKGRRTRLR